MYNTPKTPPSHTLEFEPTYHRIAQTNQWNSAAACIASLVHKPVEEVLEDAVLQFQLPANGRWSSVPKQIPDLLAHYEWWVASQYMVATAGSDLPDLALILLSKKPDQFGLFHRQKFEDGKRSVCYLINPSLDIPKDQQFRLDVDAVLPCKYLRICLMAEYMKDFW
jgi:hypothetical protein